MRKRNLKVISLLLIVVMLLNFLPASASATVSDADAQTSTGVTVVPNPDYVEPGSVRELESRREENVKHFLLPDNTVQAVVYADAVHRMDDSGNWQDISNDLSLTEYKGVKFYTTADGRVVFAEKFAPNTQLWQLSENGYSITMGMTQLQLSADATVTPVGGVTVTNAPVRRSATTWHSVEEARVVDNTASIVYANVKTNTDLEYIMIGNDIKENIVVKSRSNSYTYQFDLVLTGLAATQKGDGSISLTDSATGQQQYTIPAPYMVDAAGERSNAVIYALKQTGEGQYALTVTADSVWINADDRAFPVKIDPTVSVTDSYVGLSVTDTYIDATQPDVNYGGISDFWIDTNTIAFFRTVMPVLPIEAIIETAYFNVSYYYHDSVTTGYARVAAHQVTEGWNENTYTWNVASQRENYGLWPTAAWSTQLSGAVGAYGSTPAQAAFNITNMVRNWKNGTSINFGVALRYTSGTNESVIIYSREADAQYRPYFVINYSEIRFADGVYRLQNVGTNQYLEVRDGGYAAGTIVQQNTLANGNNLRSQLFKISFLGTNGSGQYYSVRPMTNSGMSICVSDTSNVIIDTMPAEEDYVATLKDRMWIIEESDGYISLEGGEGTQFGYLSATSGSAGTPIQITDEIDAYSQWNAIEYTDYLDGTEFVSIPQEVDVQTSTPYFAYMYSSLIGINGPIQYRVFEPDGVRQTDKAVMNLTTGVLTTLKGGTVMIKIERADTGENITQLVKIKAENCTNVVVNVYYDQAYTLATPNYSGRITNEMYELQEKYINEFGIWIDFTMPTQFACHACTNCTTSSTVPCSHAIDSMCANYDEVDESGNNPTLHHTNYSNIYRRIPVSESDDVLTVAYFAHKTCIHEERVDEYDINDNGNTTEVLDHWPDPCLGLAYLENRIATLLKHDDQTKETQIMLHEFGHLYGAPDHYDEGDTERLNQAEGVPIYDDDCIFGMNNNEDNVTSSYKMCDGCRAAVIANRYKYGNAE